MTPHRHYATPELAFGARTARKGKCLVWTGYTNELGYGRMRVHGKLTYVHRYAWERAHGPIPDGMKIDHRCHNTSCVYLPHLRLVTPKQNSEHTLGARVDNKTSGIRGVHWDSTAGKWASQVGHHGKRIFLGRFDDLAEAAEAVRLKRLELFTHNDIDRGMVLHSKGHATT